MFVRFIRVAVVGIVAFASGCALTAERVDLTYTPQIAAISVPGASDVTVSVQVVDDRQDKTKVSSKKNGYGMEIAPIISGS